MSLYTGDLFTGLIVTVTVVVITGYLVLKGDKYKSYLVLKELSSPRRAAYCIPHGPPPQLFVFKIATNLSTSAFSYFT